MWSDKNFNLITSLENLIIYPYMKLLPFKWKSISPIVESNIFILINKESAKKNTSLSFYLIFCQKDDNGIFTYKTSK